MAPRVVFPALFLLSMLATSSMAYHQQGQGVAYSPGEACYEPWGYPLFYHPLPLCRAVVRSQCLGVPVAENAKADCCRQLADVDEWCKCEALGKMLGIMHKELRVGKGQAEVFPGCRREALQRATASIPAFCKQWIPNTAPDAPGVCYWDSYPN